jgi:hypothetical protein
MSLPDGPAVSAGCGHAGGRAPAARGQRQPTVIRPTFYNSTDVLQLNIGSGIATVRT